MNPNDVAPMMISVVLFLTVGAAVILRGPVGKALARRIEGKVGADPALAERIEELEHRLAELEQERVRLGELEERLDFTERMLAAPQERGKEGSR
jgi:hypothetical protein